MTIHNSQFFAPEDLFLSFFSKIQRKESLSFYHWDAPVVYGKFNFLRSDRLAKLWANQQLSADRLAPEEKEYMLKLHSEKKSCAVRVPYIEGLKMGEEIERPGIILCHSFFDQSYDNRVNMDSKLVPVQTLQDFELWYQIYAEEIQREKYLPFEHRLQEISQRTDTQMYLLENKGRPVHCGAISELEDGLLLKWGAGTLKKHRGQGHYRDMINLLLQAHRGQRLHVQVNLKKPGHLALSRFTNLKIDFIEERINLRPSTL